MGFVGESASSLGYASSSAWRSVSQSKPGNTPP
jgi:hypothetical protein